MPIKKVVVKRLSRDTWAPHLNMDAHWIMSSSYWKLAVTSHTRNKTLASPRPLRPDSLPPNILCLGSHYPSLTFNHIGLLRPPSSFLSRCLCICHWLPRRHVPHSFTKPTAPFSERPSQPFLAQHVQMHHHPITFCLIFLVAPIQSQILTCLWLASWSIGNSKREGSFLS